MPNVRPAKPVPLIQTFGDCCGRCGGTGTINPLGMTEPGICPVCMGQGISKVFETFGNREVALSRATYADGISVTTTPGRRRTARSKE